MRAASPDLRRGAWIAIVAIAAGILLVSAAVADRQDGDDGLAALVQRVSDAGAPGVLLFVRDGDASRTDVRGVADGEPSRPSPRELVALAVEHPAQGTVTVAWNRRDASRQVVLVVNTYPLSPELQAAVRELEVAAFCEGA